MGRTVLATAAMLGLLVIPVLVSAEVPLYDCGERIESGQRATLQNDVVCDFRCTGDPTILCGYLDDETCRDHGACEPGHFQLAVGASLDLNGYSIDAAYQEPAIVCGTSDDVRGRCIVRGPGTIRGGKGSAVYSRALDIVVKDLTVSGFDTSIFTRGRVIAKGLVVLADRENSVYGGSGVVLRDVQMDGESVIQSGVDMLVDNVVLGPHSGRLQALGTVFGIDLTMIGQRSIEARDVHLRRVTVAPDESGTAAAIIRADRRMRLVDSNVATIESGRLPRLDRSTCQRSFVVDSDASWSVCSAD